LAPVQPGRGDPAQGIEQTRRVRRLAERVAPRYEVADLVAGAREAVHGAAQRAGGGALEREAVRPQHRVLADVHRAPAARAVLRQPLRAGLIERERPVVLAAEAFEPLEQRRDLLRRADRI